MKYGVVPTRLDRKVNRRNWRKPYWMGVTQWKNNQKHWLDWTKGLVPQFPPKVQPQTHQKRKGPFPTNNPNRPWHRDHQQGTRTSRPNSGRDRTGNRHNSPNRSSGN